MRHKFWVWVRFWVRTQVLFAIVCDQRQNDLAATEVQPKFPGSFSDLEKELCEFWESSGYFFFFFFICLSKLRAVTSEAIDIGGAFIAKIKRGFTDSTHCWKLWENNSIYSISSPKRKSYKRNINRFRVSLHNLWGIQCINRKSNFYGILRYFCTDTDMQNFYSELRYSLSLPLSLFLLLGFCLFVFMLDFLPQ